MNLLTLTRACVLSAACLIFPYGASAAPVNNILKVQVTAPSNWQPITGNAIEDAFLGRVGQLMANSGLPISVEGVRPVEDSSKCPYLLSIQLAERAINAKGGLDFTFTASLKTPEGQHQLGRFNSSVAEWLPSTGKFDLGRPLADAADAALRQVCSEVCKGAAD